MTDVNQFADALQQLERSRDLDPFLEQFAEQAELLRPEPGRAEHGRDGARRYWQAYLDQFEQISSEFGRLEQDGRLAELEWTGRGRLGTGREITYAGVSLLALDDAGLVTRFATYYDTSAFLLPDAGAGG